MPKLVIKEGVRIGTLTVLGEPIRQNCNREISWLVKCDCGKVSRMLSSKIRYLGYRKDKGEGMCSCTVRRQRAFDDDGLKRLEASRTFGRTYTLEEIARAAGVSRERIRQIEDKALRKLRKAVAWHGVEKEFKALLTGDYKNVFDN